MFLLMGVVLAFQVGPLPPMPPPSQPAAVVENRVVNEVHVIPQPLDPEAVAEATVQSNRASFGMFIAPPVVNFANELLNLPDIWRTTPPEWTYRNDAIRRVSDLLRIAAAALAVIAVLGIAIGKMTQQDPSAGRFLFAIVMSMSSLVWWQLVIDANNVITAGLSAPDLPGLIRPHLAMPADPVEQTAEVVLLVVYAVVAIILLLTLAFRLALIMVLIPIAPLAFLCWALPQTEGFAQMYVRISLGQVFSQVLIVIGLSLAQVMSTMGGSGVVAPFLSLIILLSVTRIPAMLASGQEQGGRSMVRTLTSVLSLRRLAFR